MGSGFSLGADEAVVNDMGLEECPEEEGEEDLLEG